MKKLLWMLASFAFITSCSSDDEEYNAEGGNTLPEEEVVYATDDTEYEIPVVFHVFYSIQRDSLEYIKEGHLPKVLDAVNRRFANCGVNLKLSFKLAEVDPQGNAMPEPGVDRQKVRVATLNSTDFLKDSAYAHYMWDQTKYLNICLFKEKNAAVLGISSFPYTLHPDTLAGMPKLMEPISVNELDYPHCVYVNSRYIYDLEPENYKTSEIVGSLCHEIAHYLGLRHAFGEDPVTYSRDCDIDTDFCEDTPTYNKSKYDSYLLSNYPYNGVFTPELVEQLAWRTNSVTGERFVSTNIMDYAVSYLNTLSPQQCERIRYILMRSPYVPGPKVKREESAAAAPARSAGKKFVFPHRIAY
jgi:zinc-dependent metalloproteinase lipoprotein